MPYIPLHVTQTVLLYVILYIYVRNVHICLYIVYILYVINIKNQYFSQLTNAGIAELALLTESFIRVHIQRHQIL